MQTISLKKKVKLLKLKYAKAVLLKPYVYEQQGRKIRLPSYKNSHLCPRTKVKRHAIDCTMVNITFPIVICVLKVKRMP